MTHSVGFWAFLLRSVPKFYLLHYYRFTDSGEMYEIMLGDTARLRPTKELPVKYSGMELGSVALKNKHSTAVINTQHTPSSRVRGAPANDPYRQVRKGRSGIKTQHVVTGDAGERNHTSVASVAGRRRRSAESARAALRAPGGGWARGERGESNGSNLISVNMIGVDSCVFLIFTTRVDPNKRNKHRLKDWIPNCVNRKYRVSKPEKV